jgi:rhodanese-related sulfurtransferase
MVWSLFRNNNDITADAVKTRIEEGWSPFILDVRSLNEIKKIGKIKQTKLIHPHSTILEVKDKIPKDCDILVTCMGGTRSKIAIQKLKSEGFNSERLFNLKGGFNSWVRAKGKVEK